MVRIKLVAMQPGSAVGYITQLYDQLSNIGKVKLLINNRTIGNIPTKDLPKDFSSGRLIDVNAGELLGLGIAGCYYNLQSKLANTYQVGVGLDDSSKNSIELILSDGTIWENETMQKMAYQQTMVQAINPERKVTAEDLIKAIKDKTIRRNDYPINCGLIINVYSKSGQIDFQKVLELSDLTSFHANLVITYELPNLATATVIRLEKGLSQQEIILNSKRFSLDRIRDSSVWEIRQG